MSFKALALALERAVAAKSPEPIVIHVVGGLGPDAPIHTVVHGRFTVLSTLPPSKFLREKSARSDAEMDAALAPPARDPAPRGNPLRQPSTDSARVSSSHSIRLATIGDREQPLLPQGREAER
jgi:hypothetical protein